MSQGMSALSNKSERMFQKNGDAVVSASMYNLTIGAVVVYGVLVNALMCRYMAPIFYNMNYLVLVIGYFVLAFAGILIAYKSDNPVISFVGYNLVVVPLGAMLSVVLQGYSGSVIFQAFFMTTIVTLVMLLAATLFPGTFAGMGRMLGVAVIGLIIAQLVCMIFRIYPTFIAWIGAAVFSLYIGYDWVKAQQYVKTIDNAVDSALDIYLDIINVFLYLLRILGSRDNN